VIGFARGAGLAARWACAVALLVAGSGSVLAGAWTAPQGEGLLIETLYGWVGDGAPWGGNPRVRENRADLQTYFEYGLNDDFTLYGQMAIERYALTGRPSSLYAGLDYSDLGLRAKLWSSGAWVVSGEGTLFLPGAYNPSSPTQAGDTGGAGEGRILAGANFTVGSTPAFLDLELGYRLRSAGPPDEWHMDATLGLKPWPGVMLMLQDFAVATSVSTDPSFPAWRQNVIEASVVLPLCGRWSLQIAWFQTLLAVKTNTERGLAVSLWRTF
jgi:hypothetical protein